MLESRGHHVTSVLGNDEAFRLDAAVIAAADSILIGFSAPYPIRSAMIHWFKELHPNIPVVALQFHSAESFPDADGGTVSDDPEVWLAAVANTLKKSGEASNCTTIGSVESFRAPCREPPCLRRRCAANHWPLSQPPR